MASVERLVARLTGNREKILRYVWIPQLSVGLFLLGLAYFQLVPIKISAQLFSLLVSAPSGSKSLHRKNPYLPPIARKHRRSRDVLPLESSVPAKLQEQRAAKTKLCA